MLLRLICVLLASLLLDSGLAWGGQDRHAPRSRVSVHDLLKGEPIPTSFAALVPLLAPGHEVVVTDQDGRRRRGKVVSISADAIVLESPVVAGAWEAALPLYWPLDVGLVLKRQLTGRSTRTFQNGSIRRIDIVDPAGNGTTIGALVGGSLVAATYLWERQQPSSSLKGLSTTLALVIGVPVSIRMGHVIDREINDPIYRAPGSLQVAIVPAIDRRVRGGTVVLSW